MTTNTKTEVRYLLREEGSTGIFPAVGFSRFYNRLSRKLAGKLRGNVYGLKQVREHIAELRRVKDDNSYPYYRARFEILKQTTITQRVALVKN